MGTNLKTFYTQCVSYSRTCKLADVAKSWPAFSSWRYSTDGYAHLKHALGDAQVTVYVDDEATNDSENFSGYSFKGDGVEVMGFGSEFLSRMSE